MEFDVNKYINAINLSEPIKMNGRITQVIGLVIESQGPNVSLGELC